MPRTIRQTVLGVGRKQVWRHLAEIDAWPTWMPGVRGAAGTIEVGAVVKVEVDWGRRQRTIEHRVAHVEPGRSVTWAPDGLRAKLAEPGLIRIALADTDDGGCRITEERFAEAALSTWLGRAAPADPLREAQVGAALARALGSSGSSELPAPPRVGGKRGLDPAEAARLLHRLMFDPIELIEELCAEHGELFTLPVPLGITPPFTFLTTREGYTQVLKLDADLGRNGPVIDRVPALARWSPRSDRTDEHLQRLLLRARQHIGACVRARADELAPSIRATIRRHLARWGDTVDLSSAYVAAIHEASTRVLLGDDLWDALGPEAPGWIRTIVNAVDAMRAATALSPACVLLPEYRATRLLGQRLLEIAGDPEANRFEFVRRLRSTEHDDGLLPVEDVAWMMFFGIWNATLYTGTYGVWALADLLDHPDLLHEVRDPGPDREELLLGGILETMRRNPISWQLRSLAAPVQVTCNGRSYEVPAGHFLSVFSHGLNRDPSVYPMPLAYRPRRYREGAPAPLLFGNGPFSCVAQRWVKRLLTTAALTVLDTVDLTLRDRLPERISRVHLLYPDQPIIARVRRRAHGPA